MSPFVSIGMPVYNGERFLAEALESLLAQSHGNFELLISDNHSTDNTRAIIEHYARKDARIKCFFQEKNIGAIANFNFVLSKASADYFMWAAADDEWDIRWIEVILDGMDPSVAISFGHVCNIDENKNVTRTYPYFSFRNNSPFRVLKYYFSDEYFGKSNVIYGMYHTAVLKNHPMVERYFNSTYGVDMLFVFEWIQRGSIICNEQVSLLKRVVGQSNHAQVSVSLIFRIFCLDRLMFLVAYLYLANGKRNKLAIFILLPLKYLKMVSVNFFRLFLRRRISGANILS